MKYNIKALRQKAAGLRNDMRDILNAAKHSERDLTADETARFDELKLQLAAMQPDIEAAEQELDRELSGDDGINLSEAEARRVGAGGHPLPYVSRPGSVAGRKYAQMFRSSRLETGGWSSLDEFIAAINFGGHDPRLAAAMAGGMGLRVNASAGAASGAVPTDGGFLVPDAFTAELLDASLEAEIVRPRAQVYPMASSTRKIAGFDGLDHSSGQLFGGFTPVWMGEGSTASTQKAKTRLIQLTAHKLALFTAASNELIADGASFADLIGNALIKALSWTLDNAFLNGDGAAKPLGVLNSPSLIVVAKDTSQPAATITYSNVSKMLARLHPSFLNEAVWVVNSTSLPQLLQMQSVVKNVAGTENVGGSAVPIFTMEDGTFRMLTLEVILTEKLPALGSQGDILLAAFSNYAVGMRREATLEKSNAPLWASDETSFRSIVRVDGQSKWHAPFTPKNGDTQGWAVTLAARS